MEGLTFKLLPLGTFQRELLDFYQKSRLSWCTFFSFLWSKHSNLLSGYLTLIAPKRKHWDSTRTDRKYWSCHAGIAGWWVKFPSHIFKILPILSHLDWGWIGVERKLDWRKVLQCLLLSNHSYESVGIFNNTLSCTKILIRIK